MTGTSECGKTWVLVAGGFHGRGAMDHANAALADHLLSQGASVHLVAHEVDLTLVRGAPIVHLVPCPRNSYLLGEPLLRRRGLQVASQVSAEEPQTRVVVNGGNCPWPDINWVHCVHAVWNCHDPGAPLWFKAKARIGKHSARRRERAAVRAARVIIANSRRTRDHLIEAHGVSSELIHTVYLGTAGDYAPTTTAERMAARVSLALHPDQFIVLFVGALSHDHNKGLDVLLAAWQQLSAEQRWRGILLVAGDGNARRRWMEQAGRMGLAGRVRFLGHSLAVHELLAAADLLVSPVRYEAYGMNVHEALERGVPVLVSASAGVAERLPECMNDMLLPDAISPAELAGRIAGMASGIGSATTRARQWASAARSHSWAEMAAELVSAVRGGAVDVAGAR
jgi:glycosyltransferase involved in cell wall biosynthesis